VDGLEGSSQQVRELIFAGCASADARAYINQKGIQMPNPKRRHSKARTGSRRAHDSLKSHALSECPNCHERKMPHRACPKCGYYKGREVLNVEEAS
jgi:large subunit ribosomal protein L32